MPEAQRGSVSTANLVPARRSLNNEHSNLLRCPARAATDTSLPAAHTPAQLSSHERVHWHRSLHQRLRLSPGFALAELSFFRENLILKGSPPRNIPGQIGS